MSVRRYRSIAVAIGAAMLIVGCSAARPLHRSETNIRSSLLKRTPPGTSSADAAAFMRGEGWSVHSLTGSPAGWLKHPGAAAEAPDREVKQTLYTDFGYYWMFPFMERHVHGFWLFDTNDQLLDVWVGKTTTGL